MATIPFSFCGSHDGHFSVFSHLIFQIRSQGRLESEIRKIVQIRKSVSRRRSQTSTAKHSRPIPNHLNGSRSSKIVDAHLRMSLRDVPCVSADSGKSPFRGRLRRRPQVACEKLFWGYGGLPPWIGFGWTHVEIGLDERLWLRKNYPDCPCKAFSDEKATLGCLDAVKGRKGDFGKKTHSFGTNG